MVNMVHYTEWYTFSCAHFHISGKTGTLSNETARFSQELRQPNWHFLPTVNSLYPDTKEISISYLITGFQKDRKVSFYN